MPDPLTLIFISYAHTDSPFVDRLEADLQQQGFGVWVDRRGLAGGQYWRRELQEAVDRSQVLLVVLSPDSVASQYVQSEYGYAGEEGKLVIPLYYRPCKVPMDLRTLQWIDFQHSYDQAFEALLDTLHHQGRTAPNGSSDLTTPPSFAQEPTEQKVPAMPRPVWKVPGTFTSLLGREQEVPEIAALLTQPEVRLLTLLGPGGIGKTRLSIAVATQLRSSFDGGICFVPLAAISDPALVLPTIAQELDLKESGTEPPLQQVQAFVGEQHFLLVLDNFEQVVAAAPQIEELLAACPYLKVLVTSRAVLHLSAEQVVPVAPLALPNLSQDLPPERLAQSPAVTLFVQRARSVLPTFQLTSANAQAIAQLCIQLDGLPLAIELAAARIKLLPPQALLTRLSQRLQLLTGGPRSLPARQQTLRSTIQWSYDLLGPEEQALFRLLSVFTNSWTLEAAEAVSQHTGKADLDILNTLSALLDNSLIQPSEQEAEAPRFLMLQTIREFGLERLVAAGEREITQAAHAHYFLSLAEQAETELHGSNQAVWLERLEQEHDNLRAALEWALKDVADEEATRRREVALRLSAALKDFWIMHGHYREARTFLERALSVIEGASASLHLSVLRAAGEVADLQGDTDREEVLVQQILALSRELEDIRGTADALGLLAGVAMRRGKTIEAISLFEEKVRLLRQVGEPGEVAEALFFFADLVCIHGEYARGQALFEEALLLARKSGSELLFAVALIQSSLWLWFTQGDLALIHQRLQQGQAIVTKVGDFGMIAHSSLVRAVVASSEGETTRARDLLQESLAFYQEADLRWNIAQMLHILGWVEQQQGEMRAARSHYEESLALNRELGEQLNTRYALEGLASVVAAEGELRWAAQLWGAAEALREVMACPMEPLLRLSYEQAVTAARSQLGEQAFTEAWQEGRSMKLEQVIDTVLNRRDEGGKQ